MDLARRNVRKESFVESYASFADCARSVYVEGVVHLKAHRATASGDDEATVACQKGGMYPTFDSAAGSGEIPVFFGILPDLILRVTWFDSGSGPIPVNVPHWGSGMR